MHFDSHGGDPKDANFEEYRGDAHILSRALYSGPIFVAAVRIMCKIMQLGSMNKSIGMSILPRSLEYFIAYWASLGFLPSSLCRTQTQSSVTSS